MGTKKVAAIIIITITILVLLTIIAAVTITTPQEVANIKKAVDKIEAEAIAGRAEVGVEVEAVANMDAVPLLLINILTSRAKELFLSMVFSVFVDYPIPVQ